MDKKLIYLSGAITGNPTYKEDFARAEKKIWDMGFVPINPAKVNGEIPLEAEFSHDDYMDVCMVLLEKADGIYLIRGWESSDGAKDELKWVMKNAYKNRNLISGMKIREDYLILTE